MNRKNPVNDQNKQLIAIKTHQLSDQNFLQSLFPINHPMLHVNYKQSQRIMCAACKTIPRTNALDARGSCKQQHKAFKESRKPVGANLRREDAILTLTGAKSKNSFNEAAR